MAVVAILFFAARKTRWPRRRREAPSWPVLKPRGLVRLGMWWKVCLQGNPRPERDLAAPPTCAGALLSTALSRATGGNRPSTVSMFLDAGCQPTGHATAARGARNRPSRGSAAHDLPGLGQRREQLAFGGRLQPRRSRDEHGGPTGPAGCCQPEHGVAADERLAQAERVVPHPGVGFGQPREKALR